MKNVYTLTKIKTFLGMEGHGLNATVCKNGKAVAFALDDASGGELRVDFKRDEQGHADEREFGDFCIAWQDSKGGLSEARESYIKSISASHPSVKPDLMRRNYAVEDWINETVDEMKNKQRFDRLSKKKTLFRLKGSSAEEWRTLAAPYSPAIQAQLDRKYPNQIEQIWGH